MNYYLPPLTAPALAPGMSTLRKQLLYIFRKIGVDSSSPRIPVCSTKQWTLMCIRNAKFSAAWGGCIKCDGVTL